MVDCDFERYFDYLSQNQILSYILHHCIVSCKWEPIGNNTTPTGSKVTYTYCSANNLGDVQCKDSTERCITDYRNGGQEKK